MRSAPDDIGDDWRTLIAAVAALQHALDDAGADPATGSGLLANAPSTPMAVRLAKVAENGKEPSIGVARSGGDRGDLRPHRSPALHGRAPHPAAN